LSFPIASFSPGAWGKMFSFPSGAGTGRFLRGGGLSWGFAYWFVFLFVPLPVLNLSHFGGGPGRSFQKTISRSCRYFTRWKLPWRRCNPVNGNRCLFFFSTFFQLGCRYRCLGWIFVCFLLRLSNRKHKKIVLAPMFGVSLPFLGGGCPSKKIYFLVGGGGGVPFPPVVQD